MKNFIFFLYFLFSFSTIYIHLKNIRIDQELADYAHAIRKSTKEKRESLSHSIKYSNYPFSSCKVDSASLSEIQKLDYFMSLSSVPRAVWHRTSYTWALENELISDYTFDFNDLSTIEEYEYYDNCFNYFKKQIDLTTKSRFDLLTDIKIISAFPSLSPTDNILKSLDIGAQAECVHLEISINDGEDYIQINALPFTIPKEYDEFILRYKNPVTEEIYTRLYELR